MFLYVRNAPANANDSTGLIDTDEGITVTKLKSEAIIGHVVKKNFEYLQVVSWSVKDLKEDNKDKCQVALTYRLVEVSSTQVANVETVINSLATQLVPTGITALVSAVGKELMSIVKEYSFTYTEKLSGCCNDIGCDTIETKINFGEWANHQLQLQPLVNNGTIKPGTKDYEKYVEVFQNSNSRYEVLTKLREGKDKPCMSQEKFKSRIKQVPGPKK